MCAFYAFIAQNRLYMWYILQKLQIKIEKKKYRHIYKIHKEIDNN